VALAAIGALSVAYGVRTYVRNHDWRSEEALFEAARRTSPRSYKAHKGVANAILAEKQPAPARLDAAIAAAEAGLAVIDIRPLPAVDQPSDLMAALGLAYILKGDAQGGGKMDEPAPPAAAEWYRKAVSVLERAVETDRAVNERVKADKRAAGAAPEEVRDVGLRRVHGTLGNAYMRLGRHDKALETFVHLRKLDPMRADGYTQSAWALFSGGRLDEAAVLLIEATFLQQDSGAGSLLGEVYRKMGIPPSKEGSLDLATPRVKGHVAQACENVVRTYRNAGRPEAFDLRETCVNRYGIAAGALDRALGGS
jgi:tetratricopeptide (TPR) repeat protein